MDFLQIAEIAMDMLGGNENFVQITTINLNDDIVDIALLKNDKRVIATNEKAFLPQVIDDAYKMFSAKEKVNGTVTYWKEIPKEEKMAEDAQADMQAKYMLEYISSENAANEIFYRELYMAMAERLPVKLVLIESKGTKVGLRNQALFKPNGELAGDVTIEKSVREEISKEKGKNNRQVDIDGITFYLMPIGCQKTVYLLGDTDEVKELCSMVRKENYRTVVIGLDKEKTNDVLLPDADGILIPKSYTDIFFHVPVDEYCSVVVMTGDMETDAFVLGQALETRSGFIAMVGQKKENILPQLAAYGYSENDFVRINWFDADAKAVAKALKK